MLQVLLNQNGPFKRAPGEFALRIPICVLWWGALLLFHANKHFREKETFELLPRLAIFADSYCAIKPQPPEPDMVSKIPISGSNLLERTFGNPIRANYPLLYANPL